MLAQVQENSCDIGHEDPRHQRIFSVENLSGLFFLICAVQHHACSRSNGRSKDSSRRIIRCTFRQYYQRVAKFSAILTGSFWAASEPAQHQQKPWVMFARFK